MDLSDLRTIVTALSFVAFVGVVIWAYNGKRKAGFDAAANLPFADKDELPVSQADGTVVEPAQQADGAVVLPVQKADGGKHE